MSNKKNLDTEEKYTKEEFMNMFARELQTMLISNPNNSSSKKNVTFPGKYSQEQLNKWLQNPTSNEKNLRNASIYMAMANVRYQRLLQYYAGIPLYSYIVTPLNFTGSKIDKESYKKNYLKATQKLELMHIREETRKQILVALREGAFYGVRWGDSLSGFTQQLDADICQITSISDGVFLFSVDMSQIKEENLNCYPAQFTEMYKAYLSTGFKYQQVPPEISVCIKADPTTVNYSIPPFAGALPELYSIYGTQSLQEASDELDNYKLVTGQVPLDDEGKPTMDYKTVTAYYSQIASNLGDRVGLAIAPFKLDSIDFSKSAAADAIDKVSQASNNFWSSCGTSAPLHGSNITTAGALKLAIKSDETFVFNILDQCESQLNRFLKTSLTGKNRFKVSFLKVSVFNLEDMLAQYKNSMNYGIGKILYMSALGIPQSDAEGLLYLENEVIEINDKLQPVRTSATMPADDNATGRPEKDDTDLEESGESTRESGANENR